MSLHILSRTAWNPLSFFCCLPDCLSICIWIRTMAVRAFIPWPPSWNDFCYTVRPLLDIQLPSTGNESSGPSRRRFGFPSRVETSTRYCPKLLNWIDQQLIISLDSAAIAGAPLVTIGLFVFAWSTYSSVHWIVPITGSGIFGAGQLSKTAEYRLVLTQKFYYIGLFSFTLEYSRFLLMHTPPILPVPQQRTVSLDLHLQVSFLYLERKVRKAFQGCQK